MIPKVLSIAGSDCSGGAGIQADLKTFSALGCYGMSVVTAITAQNTQGVDGIHPCPVDFLSQQLCSVFDDIPPDAIKVGMLSNAVSITTLSVFLKDRKPRNLVVDPVMRSSSGDLLMSKNAIKVLKTHLIPLADMLTPNGPEVEILLGRRESDPVKAVQGLLKLGCRSVLLKGGHGITPKSVDLFADKDGMQSFEAPRYKTKNTHGTGCSLSSAIAANLAKGLAPREAVGQAKRYITGAIKHADVLDVGQGAGPVHHFWDVSE